MDWAIVRYFRWIESSSPSEILNTICSDGIEHTGRHDSMSGMRQWKSRRRHSFSSDWLRQLAVDLNLLSNNGNNETYYCQTPDPRHRDGATDFYASWRKSIHKHVTYKYTCANQKKTTARANVKLDRGKNFTSGYLATNSNKKKANINTI